MVYAEDHGGRLPAQEFWGGASMPHVRNTYAASPIRTWMVQYAGVSGPWENWNPHGGGIVWEVDPMTEPKGNYGPYPKTRNYAVYCPSFAVHTVNYTVGDGTNTRMNNSLLSYAMSGLGVFRYGWRGAAGPSPLLYEQVGSTSLELLAAGMGGRPFLFLCDITTYSSSYHSQPYYLWNHGNAGGNFTDARGVTRWHDLPPLPGLWYHQNYPYNATPWIPAAERSGHLNYSAGYAIQELADGWDAGVRILVDGKEPGLTPDQRLRSLGYRRSSSLSTTALPPQ